MEYPGYGLYEGTPSSEKIQQDALAIYDYLQKSLKWSENNILLLGRSLGSGPATYVAARRNPGGLIMISPYTSIRKVVKDVAGSWLQYLVEDRFSNIDEIKFVTCPTLLIHGREDELIPYQHSIDLMCNCQGLCYINLQEAMTHNNYSMVDDIVDPIKTFMAKSSINVENRIAVAFFPKFPGYVYTKDKNSYKEQQQITRLSGSLIDDSFYFKE